MKNTDSAPSLNKSCEERIKCSECNASILKLKHMERHVSIHLKRDFFIDLFQCIYCDHTSNQNDKMAEHVKKAHRGEKQIYDDLLADPKTIANFKRVGRRCFGDEFKNLKLPVNNSLQPSTEPVKNNKEQEPSAKVLLKSDKKINTIKRRLASLPEKRKYVESNKVKRTRKTDHEPISVVSPSNVKQLQQNGVEAKRQWTPKVVFQMRTRSKSYAPPSTVRSKKFNSEKSRNRQGDRNDSLAVDSSHQPPLKAEHDNESASIDAPSPELGNAPIWTVTDLSLSRFERRETSADISMMEKTADATIEDSEQTKLVSGPNDREVDSTPDSASDDSISLYENAELNEKEDSEGAMWLSSVALTVVISKEQALTVGEQVQIIEEEEPAVEDDNTIINGIFNEFDGIPLRKASRRQRAKKSFVSYVARQDEIVESEFGNAEKIKDIVSEKNDIAITPVSQDAVLI